MLFHTVPRKFEGDTLEPRTFVTADRGIDEGHYIFATGNQQLSACYAIPNGHKHFSDMLDDGAMLLMIQAKTMAMDTALDATMFTVPREVFTPFPGKDDQHVCAYEIQRSEMAVHRRIENFDDMMTMGLQIFVPAEQPKTDQDWDKLSPSAGQNCLKFLKQLHDEGQVRWLNAERGINPHPHVAQAFGLSMQEPTQQAKATPAARVSK